MVDHGQLYIVSCSSALEIERVLLEHPDVADCAVFGVEDNVLGEKVTAMIVLAPNAAEKVMSLKKGTCNFRMCNTNSHILNVTIISVFIYMFSLALLCAQLFFKNYTHV